MSREKETQVQKNNNFEDWRQKSNEVSLDLGAVASKSYAYSELTNGYPSVIDSLDGESRLGDAYKTSTAVSGQIYVRDVSANGLNLNYNSDTFVDNTQGYIIIKDGAVAGSAGGGSGSGNFFVNSNFTLTEGDVIKQFVGNNTALAPQFQAVIVSISAEKILLRNVTGTGSFDPTLNIYPNAGSVIFLNALFIKELVVESYRKTSARVYRTRNYTITASSGDATANRVTLSANQYNAIKNGEKVSYVAPSNGKLTADAANATHTYYVKKTDNANFYIELYAAAGLTGNAIVISATAGNHVLIGDRINLPQDMSFNGYHIPPHVAYATHTLANLNSHKQFIENEVVYQGTSVTDNTFKATLLKITTASDTLGAGNGLIIFKNILNGTYNSSVILKAATTTLGGGAAASSASNSASIAASSLNNDFTFSPVDFAQMIEFNTPSVVGDDIKVFYGSAIDSILEVQDDIGTITSLGTNDKADIVTSINELETAIRGTNTDLVATRLAIANKGMTADNLVMGLVEHEKDLFGDDTTTGGKKSLVNLNTNTRESMLLAVNELETAIRGADSAETPIAIASLVDGRTYKIAVVGTSSPNWANIGWSANANGAGANPAVGDIFVKNSTTGSGTNSTAYESNTVAAQLTSSASPSAHPAMTADDLVGAILEHEVDLYGTSGSLTSLGTNDKTTFVAAINELETAIRGSDGTLVATDLAATVTNYDRAGTNLTDLLEEIHHDVGDTGNAKLGVLNTPNVENVPTVGTAAATTNTITFASGGTAGIVIGMFVTGSGNLPDNARVIGINPGANTITLSGAIKTGGIAAAVNLSFKVEDITTKVKGLDTAMGAVTATNMGTAASTLTTAIREHNDELYSSGVSFTGLAAVNFKGAIEELRTDIGDVGNSGAELAGVALPSTISNLTDAVKDIVSRMTGGVEFDTQAFHASHANGLAGVNAAYDETNFLAAIREIQTYLGNPTLLSNNGDTYQVNASTSDAGGTPASTTLTLGSNANAAVDVGYQVSGTGIQADTTIIKKVSASQFILSKTHTVVDTGVQITFTEPVGYGFADDVITTSLIALRTALVGGTADLDDKIATLIDSDGDGTDFAAGNIVDAIREVQDDIGTLSSLTNTPFAANAKIQGSYTNANLATIIASYGEYIGGADISGVSGTNNTITEAISKLHGEVGDIAGLSAMTAGNLTAAVLEHETDLYTSTSGSFTGLTSKHFKGAIEELRTELGDVTAIDDATGYAATDTVGGILELQKDVGDVTSANLGALNTPVVQNVDTSGTANTGQADIVLDSAAGIVKGMYVTGSSSLPTNARVINISSNTITLSGNIHTANITADTDLTFTVLDLTTKVKGLDDAIGAVSALHMGTTASTVVTAINEIATTKLAIGASAAAMKTAMGTNSSTVTAAIKELVDGTGAAAITVAGESGQVSTGKLDKVSGTTVVANVNLSSAANIDDTTLTFANAAAIAGIKVGAVVSGSASISTGTYVQSINGAVITLSAAVGGGIATNVNLTFTMDQSIISNINFLSPDSDDTNNVTTFKFGPNTILDVSKGILKTNDANGTFNTSAAKIVLGATTNTGQGIEIDRGAPGIVGAVSNGVDASFLWVDTKVTGTDPSSGHNLSDLAWQVSGLKYASNGDLSTSTQANLDFYNAYRLFGIGTNNTVNTNTDGGVEVTWNETNQNFGIQLSDTGVTANTYGTNAQVAQIAVNAQGRITSVSNVPISGALGEFDLQADSGNAQTVSVTEAVKIAGGTNISTTVATAGTNPDVVNTVTVALDASPSVTNLTASGKLIVQGTDAANPSTFAGDVTIAGECRANLFTQTGGGTSLSFTSTSAEVSTGELILNSQQTSELANTTNESSSARIIAHRGFNTTANDLKTGRAGTLTIGKRYRIQVLHANDQDELKTIAGLDSGAANFAVGGIFTAALTGNDGLHNAGDVALRTSLAEQFDEAKIAWNETNDTWDLYNGTATVTGSIVTQGDTLTATLSDTAKVTAATNDNNEDKQITFVDVTSATSTIQRDAGLVYNPSTNNLTVKFGTAETKISAGDSFFHSNTHIVSSTPTVATNTYPARSVQVKGSNSFVKLTETRNATESTTNTGISGTEITNLATMVNGKFYQITDMGSANNFQALINVASGQNGKDFAGNTLTAALGVKFRYINNANGGVNATGTGAKVKEVVADPTWYVGADGGNFSIRLNNQGAYPLNIQTTQVGTGVRDGFTASRIDLNYPTLVNAALTSNQIVATGSQTSSFGLVTAAEADNIDNSIVNTFYPHDIGDAAKSLSSTNLSVLKNAIFAARTGSGGNISYFEIQDVRNIGTETAPSTGYSVSSHKRLQMRVANDGKQGVLLGFIDFDADETSEKIYIGGINDGVNKTSIESNARGAAKLYFNQNGSGTAASEKLATFGDGVKVTGELQTSAFIGVNGTDPDYALDFGELTNATIRLVSEDATAIRIGANDPSKDVTILRVDQAQGETDKSKYGFSLKYMGTGGGNLNALSIFSDNQDAGSAIQALTVLQDGKIGIGTNSPDTLLELVSADPVLTIRDSETTGANCDARLRLAESDGSDTLGNYVDLGYVANKFIINKHSSGNPGTTTNHLTIDNAGKVGIGTTSPSSKLDVAGAVEADSFRFTGDVDTIQTVNSIRQDSTESLNIDAIGGVRITLDTVVAGSDDQSFTIAKAVDDNDTNSDILFNVSEGGDVQFYKDYADGDDTTGAVGMTWESNQGGLGIGTPTPSESLDVVGNIKHTGLIPTTPSAAYTKLDNSANPTTGGAVPAAGSGVTVNLDQTIELDLTTGNNNITNVTTWQDTAIEGDVLTSGSYMVQLYVHLPTAEAAQHQQYYTGVMSWFQGSTNEDNDAANSGTSNEIMLHNVGHASADDYGTGVDRTFYLRTLTTAGTDDNPAGDGFNKLQIRASNGTGTIDRNAGYKVQLKFRRML